MKRLFKETPEHEMIREPIQNEIAKEWNRFYRDLALKSVQGLPEFSSTQKTIENVHNLVEKQMTGQNFDFQFLESANNLNQPTICNYVEKTDGYIEYQPDEAESEALQFEEKYKRRVAELNHMLPQWLEGLKHDRSLVCQTRTQLQRVKAFSERFWSQCNLQDAKKMKACHTTKAFVLTKQMQELEQANRLNEEKFSNKWGVKRLARVECL